MSYQPQVVWNREFNWANYGSSLEDLDKAIARVEDIYNSGDGARVKKRRVINEEGQTLWNGYKKFEEENTHSSCKLETQDV